MREITIRLAKPLKLPNRRNLGSNWKATHAARASERRALSAEIIAQLVGVRPEHPFNFASIVIERVGIRAPDYDNLYASAKALLDCLQPCTDRRRYGVGVIAGDDPTRLKLSVEHVKAKRIVDQHTVVRIRELASSEVGA